MGRTEEKALSRRQEFLGIANMYYNIIIITKIILNAILFTHLEENSSLLKVYQLLHYSRPKLNNFSSVVCANDMVLLFCYQPKTDTTST
jgi:hypothetical protein